jgi:uncharacterized repeat protein (TIGR03803 family)
MKRDFHSPQLLRRVLRALIGSAALAAASAALAQQCQLLEAESTLYAFTNTGDGSAPTGLLTFDSFGALYGVTGFTAFKLSPPVPPATTWTQSTLYAFCSLASCADGATPSGGLIFGPRGVLYGATLAGGAPNNGVVYSLAPPASGSGPWTQAALYKFQGGADGSNPSAGLVAESFGALYGVLMNGAHAASDGGQLFKLTPPASGTGAWTKTALYDFGGGGDGGIPMTRQCSARTVRSTGRPSTAAWGRAWCSS